jgi:hypothetical protein
MSLMFFPGGSRASSPLLQRRRGGWWRALLQKLAGQRPLGRDHLRCEERKPDAPVRQHAASQQGARASCRRKVADPLRPFFGVSNLASTCKRPPPRFVVVVVDRHRTAEVLKKAVGAPAFLFRLVFLSFFDLVLALGAFGNAGGTPRIRLQGAADTPLRHSAGARARVRRSRQSRATGRPVAPACGDCRLERPRRAPRHAAAQGRQEVLARPRPRRSESSEFSGVRDT